MECATAAGDLMVQGGDDQKRDAEAQQAEREYLHGAARESTSANNS